MSVLGLGLMIEFRQPGINVGYLVICQLLISFGAGTIMICDQTAVMAAGSHQHIAVLLAVEGMFGNIGGSVGLTVAAAIWQSVFPKKLAKYLPVAELSDLPLIYEDITKQLSFPMGSPARLAIQHAYGDAQRAMLIAGTGVWVVGIGSVLMWEDIKVSNTKQAKGHVI
jgi:hypothetical protein